MRPNILTAAFGLVLGISLAAAPVDAQGKSQGKKQGGKGRPQIERVDDRIYDERGRVYEDRGVYDERGRVYDDYGAGRVARGNGAGKVPPGWCKGQGNPHNTVENCGYSSTNGRYDDRVGGYPMGQSGSYDRDHQEFHMYLDRKYSDLAARRPTDVQYQLQLRMQKSSEHNRWHEQVGIRH